MPYSLGVHVGTTSVAAAAAARGSQLEMIRLGDRGVVAPAAVYLRPDGKLIPGDLAVRRHHLDPERVVCEVRRRLGDPTPVMLGSVPHTAPALLARMVGDVVTRATAVRGCSPGVVVLTHPASWGPFRRELFAEVPRLAGLPVTRTVTEPEAAAAHYAASLRLAEGDVVAVYHLGGGTCEVTVLSRRGDGFEVLGNPVSIERLGGTDIDEAILGYVGQAMNGALAELDVDGLPVAPTLARLHEDCVLAKEALSVETSAVVPVFLPHRHVEVPLTRSALEDMIRPMLDDTMDALCRALTMSEVAPEDLQAVFLTGGSTRIPLVGRMISDLVERPVMIDAHPEFVVALGAARLATAQRGASGTGQPAPPGATATPQLLGSRTAATVEVGVPVPVPTPEREGAPTTPHKARTGRRAARAVVYAVVGALVVVAAVVVLLVVFLGPGGVLGDHESSTFIPTLTPTSTPTAGRG